MMHKKIPSPSNRLFSVWFSSIHRLSSEVEHRKLRVVTTLTRTPWSEDSTLPPHKPMVAGSIPADGIVLPFSPVFHCKIPVLIHTTTTLFFTDIKFSPPLDCGGILFSSVIVTVASEIMCAQ